MGHTPEWLDTIDLEPILSSFNGLFPKVDIHKPCLFNYAQHSRKLCEIAHDFYLAASAEADCARSAAAAAVPLQLPPFALQGGAVSAAAEPRALLGPRFFSEPAAGEGAGDGSSRLAPGSPHSDRRLYYSGSSSCGAHSLNARPYVPLCWPSFFAPAVGPGSGVVEPLIAIRQL